MDDPRLRRIALVTRRYGDLRAGVTRAIWAPCILAVGAVEYFNIHRGLWGLVFGLLNIFSWTALGLGVWLAARKWMDRRFGRVQSDKTTLDVWIVNFWMFGYFGVSFLDDSYLAGAGWPSARFLFLGGAALWCSARLWPYAPHYLVVAAVGFGFALPFADVRGEAALELWQLEAYPAMLLAWMVAGVIDLALLGKVLPQRSQEATSVDAS